MEVNFFGLVSLTKKLLPLIRESKGRIINISSLAGIIAGGGSSIYCSSKFAVDAFTDSLRKEVRPLGVAVVDINAAVIKTPIQGKILTKMGSKPAEVSDEVWGLYDRYNNEQMAQKMKEMMALGETTASSDAAIVDAAFSPRPYSRYFPGNAAGAPGFLMAFLGRVLPNYVLDYILENF